MNSQQKKVAIALKKAKTSLEKIIEKVELADEKKDCFEIVQQNLAVIGLLKSANLSILENHLNTCISGNKSKDKKFKENILKVIKTAQNKGY